MNNSINSRLTDRIFSSRFIMFVFLSLVISILTGDKCLEQVIARNPYPYINYDTLIVKDTSLLESELTDMNIHICVKNISWENGQRVIDIYGTDYAVNEYICCAGYDRLSLRGVFSGEYTVRKGTLGEFDTLEKSGLLNDERNGITVSLISDDNVLRTLSAEWIRDHCYNIYAGEDDKNIRDLVGVACVLWLLLAVFFSSLDIVEMEKELFLRITTGQSKKIIILKWILYDIAVYTSLALLIFSVLKISTCIYAHEMIICSFLIFLLINVAIYMFILGRYYKIMWSDTSGSPGMSVVMTIILTFTLMIGILNASYSYDSVSKYLRLQRSGEFYNDFKDYYVSNIGVCDVSDDMYIWGTRENITALFKDLTNAAGEKLYYDAGSYEWLSEKYPVLKNVSEGELFILIPESRRSDGIYFNEWYALNPPEYTPEVVYYSGDIKACGCNNGAFIDGLNWYTNPVIIVDMRKELTDYADQLFPGIASRYMYSYLIRGVPEASPDYVKENAAITELSELYERRNRETIENGRRAIFYLIVSVLFIALVLFKLLKEIFRLQTKEILIRRINGETFIKSISTPLIIVAASTVLAAYLAYIFPGGDISGKKAVLGGVVFAVPGSIVTILYSVKFYSNNLSLLLKGDHD